MCCYVTMEEKVSSRCSNSRLQYPAGNAVEVTFVARSCSESQRVVYCSPHFHRKNVEPEVCHPPRVSSHVDHQNTQDVDEKTSNDLQEKKSEMYLRHTCMG